MTRLRHGTLRVSIAVFLLLGFDASAEVADAVSPSETGEASASGEKKPPAEAEVAPPRASLYRLPYVGKPGRRVGGGRRGLATDLPDLFVLVPEHVGLTLSSQPVLYWYLSESPAAQFEFEFTLADQESVKPMVDVNLEGPMTPGLHRIDLKDHGARLAPGQEYQWSVSLVVDRGHRWDDVVASGWIARVAPPEGLSDALEGASGRARSVALGAAGLWYDVLDSVFTRLPSELAQRDLRQLLAHVGLPEEAAD